MLGHVVASGTVSSLRALMAHCVSDDIHADLVGHYAVLGGIARVVDPLPGVAEVAVASDENHEPAVLVFDAHVMRRHAALFIGHTVNECRDSGHLDYTVEIEVAVEDRVC